MQRWKIVPREPDTLMRLAARKAINKELDAVKRNAVYTAMLSASPPVTEEVVERGIVALEKVFCDTPWLLEALSKVKMPGDSPMGDLLKQSARAVISAIEGNDV